MFRFMVPAIAIVATAGLVFAGEKSATVKSGLEAGAQASAFNVRDITGPAKGTTLCYRCKYSASPTSAVFTREITPEVAELIATLDKQVAEGKDKKIKAFVVLLTDDADAGAKQLEKLAADKKITNVPLTIYDGVAGPDSYKIAKEAGVTVMSWNKLRVQTTHAYAPGKMTADDVKVVAADTAKVAG
ncbi:MAG TPA: hypothetical protein VF796_01330 [Humisphaera sp.]